MPRMTRTRVRVIRGIEKKIDLELQRMELQNKLLAKRIELLEESQEYRCCPAGRVGETLTDRGACDGIRPRCVARPTRI